MLFDKQSTLDTGANNPKYWCFGFNEGQTIFFFTSSVLTFEIKNKTERKKEMYLTTVTHRSTISNLKESLNPFTFIELKKFVFY